MHWSGHVFLWLAMIGWVAAMTLTGRLLDIRNGWQKQVEELRGQNEELIPQIDATKKELRDLLARKNRTMLKWGPYWDDVDGAPTSGGAVAIRVGSTQGVKPSTAQNKKNEGKLFLFPKKIDGTTSYAGEFDILQLRENDAEAVASWRLLQGEELTWQPNLGKWRVRSHVPAALQTNIPDLYHAILTQTEKKQWQEKVLQRQVEAVTKAQEHLNYRRGELLGGQFAPEGSIGLVNEILQEEVLRNVELAEVDRLRREIHDAYRQEQTLIRENLRLTHSLPGYKQTVSQPDEE